jgi:hypothetical protein
VDDYLDVSPCEWHHRITVGSRLDFKTGANGIKWVAATVAKIDLATVEKQWVTVTLDGNEQHFCRVLSSDIAPINSHLPYNSVFLHGQTPYARAMYHAEEATGLGSSQRRTDLPIMMASGYEKWTKKRSEWIKIVSHVTSMIAPLVQLTLEYHDTFIR